MLDFFKGKEIRVTFCKIGSVFNPTFQKRTDAMEDITRSAREKDRAKLNKMFHIEEETDAE